MEDGRLLVTGAIDQGQRVRDALEADGLAVTLAHDGDLLAAVAQVPDRSLAGYVQLPAEIHAKGDDLVQVVHDFLDQGLLSRFRLVSAALPKLGRGAGVLLVAGNHPPETATPDDHRARMGLLGVLAHAVRAETQPRGGWVRVVDSRAGPEDLVDLLRRRGGRPLPAAEVAAAQAIAEFDYASWRTAVMTMTGGRS